MQESRCKKGACSAPHCTTEEKPLGPSSSQHRGLIFCARGCGILPHINMEAGDERPHLLQVIYPAVHGDTSLGVSNVVAKTGWPGIGYAVQRKPISYCVAGGTSCHPDPGCRYSLPGKVRTWGDMSKMWAGSQWNLGSRCIDTRPWDRTLILRYRSSSTWSMCSVPLCFASPCLRGFQVKWQRQRSHSFRDMGGAEYPMRE